MDDLSEYFDTWKKTQLQMVESLNIEGRKKSCKQLKRKVAKRKKLKKPSSVKTSRIHTLTDEFLEKLSAEETPVNKVKSEIKPKKKITKLKVTSAVIDSADFIPLDANVTSTEFKLVGLDKGKMCDELANNVVETLNKELYGKQVKRIPSKTLFSWGLKMKVNQSLCAKK